MAKGAARDVRGLPTTAELFRRLRLRPRDADRFDAAIEARCVRDLAILVCDSSGFTRRTHDYGIIHFLTAMTRAWDAVEVCIARHRGSLIARGADNLVAVFDGPAEAVASAIDMQRVLAKRNRGKGDADRFHLCMGIHHGKVLRLKDGVFGDKVNIAAKIGEDLASADEIVVTGEAAARLPGRVKRNYLRTVELGGRGFELHRVSY